MAREDRRGTSLRLRNALDISAAAQLACLLEATAPKPGNVSPGRSFEDVTYEDFLVSAAAIGHPFATAATQPLGETILAAVEATARWTGANTNLGIVLLLAPLACAAGRIIASVAEDDSLLDRLRGELDRVLEATDVDDTRHVYAAIRLAKPGGLGRADAQDVADEPTVTLLDAMRLAADRDGIAREYATTFATTFEIGTPAVMQARADGLSWNDAIVETFLALLAAAPDTHVARRGGDALAATVSRLADEARAAGGVRSDGGRRAIATMDATLRGPGNLANPGTTADLIAASIFVALVAGDRHPQEGS
jgi:triphosphoribosyl-dephospho-CoA synthase